MAFGLGFGFAKNYACSAWSPASLFTAGEQGVWYDPSDFSTLFQDSAGTTPVTAVEQPVGLMLDKSGRGNHATQATSTKRPILKQDANGKYYLLFDGVDDALATGSIDFTSTDKMTVVAGVRKLSNGYGMVCELSADLSAGSFSLYYELTGWTYRTSGSVDVYQTTTGQSAPVSNVLTTVAGIAADVATLRINGTQAATSAADQGTGNFGNYPLYIGSRAGTGLPFNGNLYSLIVRGAQSTDAQIVSAETYVNGKTGAF